MMFSRICRQVVAAAGGADSVWSRVQQLCRGGPGLVKLQDRGTLFVSGDDAEKFLQSQTTNDVKLLTSKPALYTAFLNHQGRVLGDSIISRVVRDGTAGFLLESDSATQQRLKTVLQRFILRSKVKIEADAQSTVCVMFGPVSDTVARATAAAGGSVFIDPRSSELGTRLVAPVNDLAGLCSSVVFCVIWLTRVCV
jgi:folate-binding Fe-S cluster repair protein YgfZ